MCSRALTFKGNGDTGISQCHGQRSAMKEEECEEEREKRV